MNRREAVKSVAIIMGGVMSASTMSVMLSGCSTGIKEGSGLQFTDDEKKMVNRMADIIIPKTDTPGAVEAGVPDFIVMMMQDCYPEKDQQDFHAGLAAFDKLCRKQYKNYFLKLSPDKQGEAVLNLDKTVLNKNNSEDSNLSFYRKLKELTLLGFFTSEPGATQVLRYVQIPGRYDGCVPYKKGEKAWATS